MRLAPLIAAALTTAALVAGCAEESEPDEPESVPPRIEGRSIVFDDGTEVRVTVNGSLPPPCVSAGSLEPSLGCIDRQCDFAEFELEDASLALARTERLGIVVDPQIYELSVFVRPDDCLDDNP